MKRVFWLVFLVIFSSVFVMAEESDVLIKESYKLEGLIEYDENPIEVIYLDEEIEKPKINISKRSLQLPVGVLNITSNTNSQRSALARATINRGSLKDILPLSGSVTEQIGQGFSYGQIWEQEMPFLSFSQLMDF